MQTNLQMKLLMRVNTVNITLSVLNQIIAGESTDLHAYVNKMIM